LRYFLLISFLTITHLAKAQKENLILKEINTAMGGIADYDPDLMKIFFDSDELEIMLADLKQRANSGASKQNTEKSINLPTKRSRPFSKAPAKQLTVRPESEILAYASPNYIRGYILLKKSHIHNFRSYELYEQSGELLGKGKLTRRKTIRVPWRVKGMVKLILDGSAGTQSFQFMASP
jgi:hypothetical protein